MKDEVTYERARKLDIINGTKLAEYQCEVSDMIMALKEDYDIEENVDSVFFKSHDPFEIEHITIGYRYNSFGIMRFYGSISQFDRSNDEIETLDSIGCNWDGTFFDDDEEMDKEYAEALEYAETKADFDIAEWKAVKPKFINIMGTDLNWTQVIHEEVCFNNVTHYHTLKGYQIDVDSHSLETVVGIIQLRDIFFKIQTFLSQEASV